MDIRSRLHVMVDDILGDDPRTALIAFRELSGEQLPWLEQRVVALARRDEWAWARIARLLGRSRQQVHQRFRTLTPALPHDPMAAHRRWETEAARLLANVTGRASNARATSNSDDEAIPW
ncbi:unannotated protein [freshwater metagenome]|uniref:Unannotated protein n=1 Tax=freshwater metagenome TaxID=449393 RepID=A0A6J7EXJ9_9ZZZZ